MKILSIDTSNKSSSVSILENDDVIGEIFLNCGLVHSKTIYSTVKNLIDLTSSKMNEIDLLAVCTGPGSYTGIRIGTSLIKGLSFALNKPCIGVFSLLTLAHSVDFDNNSAIYSCINANKDEIYFNSYDFCKETSKLKKRFDDSFISFDKLSSIIKNEKKQIIFVGNASELCYNKFNMNLSNAKFKLINIHSSIVGKVAYEYFDVNRKYSASELTPNYLKEVKIERKKK